MDLLPFFQACENSGVGQAIRTSQWLFPAIEAVHLLGLSVIGGAVLLVDLRLLGFGFTEQRVSQLARDVRPWLVSSLIVMLITGVLLFLAESVKCYYSPAFWFKMESLACAIVFTFTVRYFVVNADERKIGPLWGKLTAIASLALWFGVGAGGRWIGFS
jgi:hypothetical protein